MADCRIGQLKPGARGRVVGYLKQKDKAYRRKLMAMGLLPGTGFEIVRVAPLGDPVELRVRGFSLTLRKDEADSLRVEKIDD